MVAEPIRAAETRGTTDLVFRPRWPGMDHATALRSLQPLGEKIRRLVGP